MVDEFGNDRLGVDIFMPSLTSEKWGRFKLVDHKVDQELWGATGYLDPPIQCFVFGPGGGYFCWKLSPVMFFHMSY